MNRKKNVEHFQVVQVVSSPDRVGGDPMVGTSGARPTLLPNEGGSALKIGADERLRTGARSVAVPTIGGVAKGSAPNVILGVEAALVPVVMAQEVEVDDIVPFGQVRHFV